MSLWHLFWGGCFGKALSQECFHEEIRGWWFLGPPAAAIVVLVAIALEVGLGLWWDRKTVSKASRTLLLIDSSDLYFF